MDFGVDDDDEVYTSEADEADVGTFTAEKTRSDYEVDFRVLDAHDIRTMQHDRARQVADILGISTEHSAILLRYFKWNKEELIERYMDGPETVLQKAGVITDDSTAPRVMPAPAGFCCDICCDDEPGLESLALRCAHRFCRSCYEDYLRKKVVNDGESRRIQCPATHCSVIVDERTVERLVPAAVYTRYQMLLTRTFVDDSPQLRWCPAPSCEYVVKCDVPQAALRTVVPTVQCRCGTTFCHGCGLEDHLPCICELVKLWLRKCADDSETSNWIQANTKECIKCHSTIEKNGGCNHMTCRKCHHEFCWVCLGPWSEHGTNWYNCNRFDESSSKDARDSQARSRQQLERYLHYYNRYANHDQSARLDKELHTRTEKKMEEMQRTSSLSWIEVQFLRVAVDKLYECRMTLKWTYAFAYYLTRDNQTALFEDNQRDLEMAVEALSELLEKPIDPTHIKELKQDVLNKTSYVAKRRETLLEDTARGLMEERWKYQVTL
ncbi:hypothetical protein SYNPS1DRAFT_16757 [Syncephalis pseudoplumigaleata]|uniref:RBR-type E3 ubiquitin transferase n=1 Tax=Syncephalis pseudoplumigaleata TaxID=1712513 RepID=A0A4P9Z063_9FUNG|nr:hypothetical protein SYNPS1DRAFT_16757 [Syncephalis pseudoplumigaleata]|eukprot:RKP24720.1 hypothetical protein SYNPS1DRAFT_16757 [Syncephalis pseudoplumigaleata]